MLADLFPFSVSQLILVCWILVVLLPHGSSHSGSILILCAVCVEHVHSHHDAGLLPGAPISSHIPKACVGSLIGLCKLPLVFMCGVESGGS